MMDSRRGVMKLNMNRRVCTCWSSVFEAPGPCSGRAGRECVDVREGVRVRVRVGVGESVRVSVCSLVGWRSRRSPVRESSRSRWLRSRCGSDSGAYPPPLL